MRKFSDDKKLQLSILKHDILKAHLQKLDDGDFESEVSNYIYFYDKFLKKIFGYDLDKNIDHEKRFGRGKVEFSLKNDEGEDFMVIELKDQTVDLDKPQHRTNDKRTPVEQAWGYLQDAPSVNWIMVSNFQEFRLYNIEERGKYLCFTADELLDPDVFSYFMIAFSRRSHIEKGYADRIVHETLMSERDLEKNFYKLYHETRLMLIQELKHNSQLGRLDAIHYAQLILNRYMFICFAKDTGLLPAQISADTISTPILKGNIRRGSIWQRLNELFLDINEGNLDKKVSEYNGGLFREDLDFLKIRDQVDDQDIFKDAYQNWDFEVYEKDIEHLLGSAKDRVNPIYHNLLIISSFDFSSELDVNILGHIFENSIGDIEELKADTKGRRKKEGIFYTPDYITDYICRNTIIPYLSRTGKPNTVPELIGEYWGSDIEELDQKVKDIKIVDPACGSGAFLSKAADILVEIHEAIHNELYKDNKTLDKHFDTIQERRTILLNNIYGIDLNEESVEITKLSLFLKVCRKDLKLPNLDQNIKTGNSIIDDPEYTDKPFNWETEFPEIFQAGGFDIVIGNPPYVRHEKIKEIKPYLKDNYRVYTGLSDLYVYFFEKGLLLLKDEGMLAYISSNKFMTANYGKLLRELILKDTKFESYFDHSSDKVFDDAIVHSCVVVLKNTNPNENKVQVDNLFEILQSRLGIDSWSFENPVNLNLKDKIYGNKIKIKNLDDSKIYYGIKTGYMKAFVIDEKTKNRLILDDPKNAEIIKPFVRGKDLKKWKIDYNNLYLILSKSGIKLETEYPSLYQYFKKYEEKLNNRADQGKYWYNLRDCAYYAEFEKEKIIWAEIAPKPRFTIDEDNLFCETASFIMKKPKYYDLKYLAALLNSNLLFWVFKQISPQIEGKRLRYKKQYVEQLPIYPATPEEQQSLVELADVMLDLNKQLQDEVDGFLDWLKHTFGVEKLSKKLEKYYELDLDTFLEELRKKKVDVKTRRNYQTLKKEFEESLSAIVPLQQRIQSTDDEIDRMVYELYGLSDDEIKIIEDSLKN
ncbi:Eco57I restriction-modification methylase domain-containing protein [Methanobacterium sp. CWC-01]|uniref:Eco57I restriction-modification methylase domain-containing protein n=1 Tax=Methanobacterium aridiramus TaxID=2584467 RepID=UPI0025777523|nr:DNA methyltransferase [Methanobacterium sp. CWC-01]